MIEISSTPNSDFLKIPRRQLKGSAKWADIEDLINRWAKRFPREAYELEKYVKDISGGLYDKKHGLQGGQNNKENLTNMRIGVAIHPHLMQYIQAFYPDFMDSKEDLHEFKKRFPKFRIPEA